MTEPVQRFPALDALRGIAALSVILTHSRQLVTPGTAVVSDIAGMGARGVQLFYVLSAFSLCLSLQGRARDARGLRHYFIRRLFRIGPLWWCAIAVYSAATLLGAVHFQENVAWGKVLLAALFLHGVHPDTITSVVPGGWSIAVETSFYLLLPFVFFRVTSLLGLFKVLVGTLALENVLRRVLLYLGPAFFPAIGFKLFYEYSDYWLISQLPIFLLGILSYHGRDLLRNLDPPARRWLLLLSGVLLVSLMGATTHRNILKNDVLYAAVFALFVPLVMDLPISGLWGRILLYLGKISYGLYLMHGLVIQQLLTRLPGTLRIPGDYGFLAAFLVVVVVTAAIASVTYVLIEEPGQRMGRRLIQAV